MKTAVEFPVASALPSWIELGLGMSVGFVAAMVNLVPSAPAPTFFFIVLRDGGPPTMIGLDSPDQGADQRPKLAVGPT